MESPHLRHPRVRRFDGFAARRPLTTVLLLLFPTAYGLQLLWGLAYYGVLPGGSLNTLIGAAPDEFAALLGNAAMIVIALYVIWAREGRAGLRTLARRIVRWRVGLTWWLAALVGLPLLTVVIFTLAVDLTIRRSSPRPGDRSPAETQQRDDVTNPPV